MKREVISIQSDYEDLVMHATVTIPDHYPIAIVHVMGGFGESRYLYDDLCTVLASYGYVTICTDYRGHGQSIDARHPLGHMADQNGWIDNLKDQNVFAEWIRENYRRLPYYVYAEGLGTIVARSFLKRYEYQINAMIFCSLPAYHQALMVQRTMLERDMKKSGPQAACTWFTSRMRRRLDARTRQKGVENAWLSSDPSVISRYNTDSLSGFDFSNRTTADLIFGYKDVYVNKDWHPLKKKLPILILTGEQDVLAEYPRGLQKSIDWILKSGYSNLEKIDYPQMRSKLSLGQGSEAVYRDIILWYNQVTEMLSDS